MTKDIKAEFAQAGTQQPQGPTPAEMLAERKKFEDMAKANGPFLKKYVEYMELEKKSISLDVEMGRRPAYTVPGILGLELQIREIDAQTYLTGWKREQEQGMQMAKEQEKMTTTPPPPAATEPDTKETV